MKNKIKELRLEAGYTQKQLADLALVSSRTISFLGNRTIQSLSAVGLSARPDFQHHSRGVVLLRRKSEGGGPKV